jgi:hypothetical protein
MKLKNALDSNKAITTTGFGGLGGYAAGTTYGVCIEMDTAAGAVTTTYSKGELSISSSAAVTDLKGIGGVCLYVHTNSGANKTAYVDNLKIEQYTSETVPTPVTEEFTWSKISNESQNAVTGNLNLMNSFASTDYGTFDVEWSSSDENIIGLNGSVTQDSADTHVTLTASLNKEGVLQYSIPFDVRVLAAGDYFLKENFTTSGSYVNNADFVKYTGADGNTWQIRDSSGNNTAGYDLSFPIFQAPTHVKPCNSKKNKNKHNEIV